MMFSNLAISLSFCVFLFLFLLMYLSSLPERFQFLIFLMQLNLLFIGNFSKQNGFLPLSVCSNMTFLRCLDISRCLACSVFTFDSVSTFLFESQQFSLSSVFFTFFNCFHRLIFFLLNIVNKCISCEQLLIISTRQVIKPGSLVLLFVNPSPHTLGHQISFFLDDMTSGSLLDFFS